MNNLEPCIGVNYVMPISLTETKTQSVVAICFSKFLIFVCFQCKMDMDDTQNLLWIHIFNK